MSETTSVEIEDPTASVVDLSTQKDALVRLPGVDKPVPAANLLTRDQYLAATSRKADELRAQYGEAMELYKLLETDEGAEKFAAALIQSGYGKSILEAGSASESEWDKMSGGSPIGGSSQPTPSNDQVAALLAEVQQLRQQNMMVMQQFANFTAGMAVEKEVDGVKKLDPNADVGALAELTQKLRGGATLADAFKYQRADALEAELAKAKETIARYEMMSKMPGLDDVFATTAPKAKPDDITPANKEERLRTILQAAAQKVMAEKS